MDGVDDYLQTPIITFKEIVLDVEVKLEGSPWKYITDARGWNRRLFACKFI